MGEDLDLSIKRLNDCLQLILSYPDSKNRKTLMKFYQTATKYVTECSKELVRCRRLNFYTVGYRENYQNLVQSIDNLEQHITLGYLIAPN